VSPRVAQCARGKPATGMRGYGLDLSETDIGQLIVYIRSLPAQPAPHD
jgi:hypothetical protein